jgi:zinc/manganese transport system substrate-binding protein
MKNISLILGLMALSCSAWSAPLQVVTTLPTYAAIARVVGGPHIEVTSLARGTEDPHFVDARPSFVPILNRADALIEGGAQLETGWLPPLVQSARNPRIQPGAPGRVRVNAGVSMLGLPTGPVSRSEGDVHAGGNPHFELDPVNGVIIARHIAEALGRLDPEHQPGYQTRLRGFADEMKRRLAEWNAVAAPLRGVTAVAYHQTYEYLAARFGFRIAGYVEPKPGITPSPSHIARLVPAMKQAGVRLLIMEPNRPARTPAYVAEKLGVPLVQLPAMVEGHAAVDDYFALIDHNLRAMVSALK